MTEQIIEFVRDRLGCRCPAEVFRTIRVNREPELDELAPGGRLIRIGGRLLVVVLSDPDQRALPATLSALVETGRRLRDREGYNRLRLVIAATNPSRVSRLLTPLFDTAAGNDDRLHLHVIDPSELPVLEAGT